MKEKTVVVHCASTGMNYMEALLMAAGVSIEAPKSGADRTLTGTVG